VLSLAETIAGLCASGAAQEPPRHLPARAGEIRHSVGCPETARRMLGLGEPRALREGLADVIGWIRAGRPGLAPG
jgi:UDP-glucose 4-epimerase